MLYFCAFKNNETNYAIIDMEQNQQTQPPVFNQPQQPVQPQYQPRVTVRPMMGMLEAIKTCFKKYCNFKGRARRSEFWWFVLLCAIIYILGSFAAGFLASFLGDVMDVEVNKTAMIIQSLIMLCLTLPFLAVLTRRLHDTSRGGWWVALFTLIGLIYGVSYTTLMWPIMDKMTSVDPYVLANQMTGVMLESPMLATMLSFGGIALFVMVIILFVFTLLDSKWGENKYGPSPKYQ